MPRPAYATPQPGYPPLEKPSAMDPPSIPHARDTRIMPGIQYASHTPQSSQQTVPQAKSEGAKPYVNVKASG